MFGHILSDYLVGHDFWGYGDIDLIYGNIPKFITRDMLEQFDCISCRKDWMSGAFAVYKNSDKMNELYKKSSSYRAALETGDHWAFDECCGNYYEPLMQGGSIFDLDDKESMTTIVKREAEAGVIKAYFKDMVAESINGGGYYMWKPGLVCNKNGNQVMLFHYVTNRTSSEFFVPLWRNSPQTIYITPTGLYTENEFKSPIFLYIFVGGWLQR